MGGVSAERRGTLSGHDPYTGVPKREAAAHAHTRTRTRACSRQLAACHVSFLLFRRGRRPPAAPTRAPTAPRRCHDGTCLQRPSPRQSANLTVASHVCCCASPVGRRAGRPVAAVVVVLVVARHDPSACSTSHHPAPASDAAAAALLFSSRGSLSPSCRPVAPIGRCSPDDAMAPAHVMAHCTS